MRFHEALGELVGQLNTVHEAYAARALGVARYRELLAALPARLRGRFVEERFQAYIEPLLQPQSRERAVLRLLPVLLTPSSSSTRRRMQKHLLRKSYL